MVTSDGWGDPDTVDQAIRRVLLAERDARDAVERCRAEAVRILAAAEAQAGRIANRTEYRLKLVSRLADQAIEGHLRKLGGAQSSAEVETEGRDVPERLDRAVEDLVDEILSPPCKAWPS